MSAKKKKKLTRDSKLSSLEFPRLTDHAVLGGVVLLLIASLAAVTSIASVVLLVFVKIYQRSKGLFMPSLRRRT